MSLTLRASVVAAVATLLGLAGPGKASAQAVAPSTTDGHWALTYTTFAESEAYAVGLVFRNPIGNGLHWALGMDMLTDCVESDSGVCTNQFPLGVSYTFNEQPDALEFFAEGGVVPVWIQSSSQMVESAFDVNAFYAKGGVVWHPVKPVAEGRANSSGLALVAEVGTIMAQGGSATFLRIGVGMAFFDR